MADSPYNHYHAQSLHAPTAPLPPPPHAGHTSRKSAVFARLAQPFVGSSRPPSSSGLGEKTGNGLPPTSVPTSAPNPLNPRTVRYNLDSPLLALSANPDNTRVVVAGREALRVLRVGYNEVSEHANLRVPGEHRKQFQHDVKWGTLHQENTIATAGTNGTIFLYDMRDGLLDRQLREHGRQVHKIAFNPADGRLLLSASQDGTIKLWDLREKKSRITFAGKAEAARDVQFNAMNAVEFAAGFDNGSVQRWDYRNPGMYERRISGHNGPVFSVAWHPDGKHCASGGRDRKVHVWDVYGEQRQPHAKHTIFTMASVSRIAWRPVKGGGTSTTELATCAINNDHRIHVWDLRRPYIPSRIVDEHDNCTTGILWKDEDILWSCSKDGAFVQNDVAFASRPINSLPHSAFAWGPGDEFTFATQRRARPARARSGASLALSSSRGTLDTTDEDLSLRDDRRRHGRSSSFKGSKPSLSEKSILDGPLDKYELEQTAARVTIPSLSDNEAFAFFAERYVFDLHGVTGVRTYTLSQACERNARLAWRAQKYRAAQTWKMLQLAISAEDASMERASRRPSDNVRSSQHAGGLVARRALGVNGDHGAHHSGGTTPLAGPVSDSPAGAATPVPGKAPAEIDEHLLLPPAAFGTSASSSTDNESVNGVRSHKSNVSDIGGGVARRPSLAVITAPAEQEQHPRPHQHTDTTDPNPSSSTESVDPVPPRQASIDRDDHPQIFTASAELSDPLSQISPPPPPPPHFLAHESGSISDPALPPRKADPGHELADQDHSHSSTDNTATSTASFYGTSTLGRKFSLVSEQTSSSYNRSELEGPSDEDALQNSLDPIPEEMINSGILKRPASTTIPELRMEAYDGTPPPQQADKPLHPQHQAARDLSSDDDLALRPWSLHRIVPQLVEYYSHHGDVQFLSVLTLLLHHRVAFDERRAEEWTEGYLTLLKRQRMFTRAAAVVKASPAGWGIREGAQWGVFVDVACPRCGRLLRGAESCSECVRAVAVCGVCETRVRGRWTMCANCEHGGHETCVRGWFVGSDTETGMRECFREGCGCVCLPR